MKIIIFQIVIFLLFITIGYKTRLRLNIITACTVIFTLSMVNTTSLMLLQFLTIIISYRFVHKRGTIDEINKKVDEHNRRNRHY
jgi:hypothetical protein